MKQSFKKKFRHPCVILGLSNSSGVSLIIAILFVSALMLVLAGLAEVHIKTIRNMANRGNESKARYLIESAENLARFAAGLHGTGWNSSESDILPFEQRIWAGAAAMGISSCTAASPCAGMEVKGRPDTAGTFRLSASTGDFTDYYSTPAVYVDESGKKQSTGNGSSTCALSENDDNFANDPCNWNKLSVGETVEIPLYYKDSAGEHKLIPPALGSDAQFKLRVRAPGHPANTGEYLFPAWSDDPKPPYYRNIKEDPVLMQWMIYGTKAGISKALIANDKSSGGIRDYYLDTNNTEISGGRINTAVLNGVYLNDFIVLKENHQGKQISTDGSESSPAIKDFDVDYPILRLNLVGQPKRNQISDGGIDLYDPATDSNDFRFNLPYLEYQVLANTPFADAKSTITGWAQVGDYRKEFKKYVKREATLGGFAFEQF